MSVLVIVELYNPETIGQGHQHILQYKETRTNY